MKPKAKGFRHKGDKDGPPYHYTECGLDDVYLISGYKKEKTAYGEGVTVCDVDELHKAIGKRLVKEKKVLSGNELRFLRKELDLTQSELGQFVGVTDQQVARWEKDETPISSAADYVIRFIYLEHIAEKPSAIRDFIETLKKVDESRTSKIYFEDTTDGWKAKAAA